MSELVPSLRAGPCRSTFDRQGHPDRASEVEPVVGNVGYDDITGAGVPGDDGRHDPDRAGPGDEHVLAEDRER